MIGESVPVPSRAQVLMDVQALAHFIIVRPRCRRPRLSPEERRGDAGRNPVEQETRVARRSRDGWRPAACGHKHRRRACESQEPHIAHPMIAKQPITVAQVAATRMCMCSSKMSIIARKSAYVIGLSGSNPSMPILFPGRGRCQAPEFLRAGLAAARLGRLFGPHNRLPELSEPFAAV